MNGSAVILTPLRGPEGYKVIGVMHLAETVDLDLHLVRGVWLQDFQHSACLVAVGLHGLPYALSNHPDQDKGDVVTERQCAVTETREPAKDKFPRHTTGGPAGHPMPVAKGTHL